MNSFNAALKGESHEETPVWFMRQAGRYLPGYTKIRKGHSIKEICMDRSLTLSVTREPLDLLGVDAAIIFSDITIPLEAMGFELEFQEGLGPVIFNSLQNNPSLSGISDFSVSNYQYSTYNAIREFKETSSGFPIVGFSGGPLTLASYVVLGRADTNLSTSKKLMFNDDKGFSKLMDLTKEMVIQNCKEQIRSGADAIQIFDSWAGFLSPHWFRIYAEKYLSDIQAELSGLVPTIYFSTQTCGMPEELLHLGFDFLSVDWRCEISEFSRRIGNSSGLQGNLDPSMVAKSPSSAVSESGRIARSMKDQERYIFNLGHGVLPDTKPETLREIVRTVHQFR